MLQMKLNWGENCSVVWLERGQCSLSLLAKSPRGYRAVWLGGERRTERASKPTVTHNDTSVTLTIVNVDSHCERQAGWTGVDVPVAGKRRDVERSPPNGASHPGREAELRRCLRGGGRGGVRTSLQRLQRDEEPRANWKPPCPTALLSPGRNGGGFFSPPTVKTAALLVFPHAHISLPLPSPPPRLDSAAGKRCSRAAR